MFIRDVRRSGRWFPERGCILEHKTRSSVLGRWFCVTGAPLRMTWHRFFVADALLWTGGVENRKTNWYEDVSSAPNFLFLNEVSQNCFVIDVVNFEIWGHLAELFRFLCCQLRKLRKSGRIVSCLTLSIQKLTKSRRIAAFSSLQVDRQTDRQAGRQADKQIDG